MTSEADEIRAALKEKLSESRNGRVLGAGLVETVLSYLVDVVKVKDVNELDIKDLKDTAEGAWEHDNDGASLPSLHVKAIAAWHHRPHASRARPRLE